jgi:hypothetical protein
VNLIEQLGAQYKRVAVRYADVIGIPPPPLEADPEKLRQTIQLMVDAINGNRNPSAGEPVNVTAPFVTVSREAGAVVSLVKIDAEGRRCGTMMFTLVPSEAAVDEFLDVCTLYGRRRLAGH